MNAVVLRGDAAHLPLPDGCADLIVTSPPYFGLRSYSDTVKCYDCIQMEYAGRDPRQAWPDYDAHVREVHQRHYDGQVGSEATPAEYIAALVACTAEWARVLKPSGSLFVNLGDGYAGQPPGPQGATGQRAGRSSANEPWRSADYAGVTGRGVHRPGAQSEWTNANAAWLAAVLDCEGSVSGRIFTNTSGGESFVTWMRVAMMDREVVDRIYEITGVGRVFQDGRGVWTYHVASQAARYVLERIWPWLRIKQKRALAAIELCRHVEERAARGRRTLTSDDLAYRAMLVGAIRDWNGHPARPNDYEPPVPAKVRLPDRVDTTRAKSLRGLPWRYALACMDELGLILRRDIIWSKPNGLPESVTDRCRSSHEYLFHFTVRPRYYAAVDEIREAYEAKPQRRFSPRMSDRGEQPPGTAPRTGYAEVWETPRQGDNPLGKLPGSVWEIPSQPLSVPARLGVDHFAAFPMELPRRCVLGWSPPGICTGCGEGRRPTVDRKPMPAAMKVMPHRSGAMLDQSRGDAGRNNNGQEFNRWRAANPEAITGYACACPDDSAPVRPALVVDPFGGTGTTALVASMLGRTGVSVDLSADYCRLARWRTTDPGERARALQVPKPPPVPDGQASLFDEAS